MAFDIQGTFNATQFARFRDYARNQVQLIDARISHLEAERDRLGSLSFAYDAGGEPTGYNHDATNGYSTYCGKLFGAYVALGGDPDFDLQVRSTQQPVFQLAGDESQSSQLMSNGEVMSVQGLADAESAILMQRMRGWVAEDLQRRKEALERKIRRAIDYAEQLNAEISELRTIKASLETDGSLEFLINNVNTLIADGQYTALTNDEASPDPHGKFARAPVAGYMPGPTRPIVTTYERTTGGGAKPNE